MKDAGDALLPAEPLVSAPATDGVVDPSASATPAAPDDRAARRAALRDLAAMIGVEVFY